jgi:adenosylmethionine-8-amino-7-oxononanoate aminotransferase
MLIYPPEILSQMRDICAQHGVLFIADEVMTAWGRTGTLLACQKANVTPDILCLSKGLTGGSLPLAVTMASEPVYAAHHAPDRAKMFFHSSSYTANPIACAAANANLAIWREEPVLDRIAALSAAQKARISGLSNAENPRTCGTIAACELGGPEGYLSDIAPRLMAAAREAGVLLRPLGSTVYVMPPYCIDDASLDEIYAVIEGFS